MNTCITHMQYACRPVIQRTIICQLCVCVYIYILGAFVCEETADEEQKGATVALSFFFHDDNVVIPCIGTDN